MNPLPFQPAAPGPEDEPAEELLARLLRALAGHAFTIRLGGATVEVAVRKTTPADVAGSAAACLRRCDRDILTVLAAAGRRLTGSEIERLLATEGDEWSTATVHRSLARLVRLKILSNNRTAPQGYVLAARA